MRVRCILAVTVAMLLWANHLPAPISEEATPPPAPEQTAKAKPTRTSEAESNRSARPQPAPTQAPVPAKKFAGKWSGIMPEIPWGNVQTELIVVRRERRWKGRKGGS